MRLHRLLLALLLSAIGLGGLSCDRASNDPLRKLTIGLVSYDRGADSANQYEDLKEYLSERTQTSIDLEPAFNELQAVDQIERGRWSIVFAPPGLAAIAISQEQYTPIFPMQGANNLRSVIVVQKESPIETLDDLHDKVVALGEPGSAAGYYLPLYDLYGLTLTEVRFAPTPKTVLEWLSQGSIDAGALSEEEFERYRHQFESTQFRVLHASRNIPPGLVLFSPTLEFKQQRQIAAAMREAPPNIVGDAGYLPNVKVLDYQLFIELVKKVRPLETRVGQKPAVLTMDETSN